MKQCPRCGEPPLLFENCDSWGCLTCDIWTEQPHACTLKYGACDEGFADAPESPGKYQGIIKYPPEYK